MRQRERKIRKMVNNLGCEATLTTNKSIIHTGAIRRRDPRGSEAHITRIEPFGHGASMASHGQPRGQHGNGHDIGRMHRTSLLAHATQLTSARSRCTRRRTAINHGNADSNAHPRYASTDSTGGGAPATSRSTSRPPEPPLDAVGQPTCPRRRERLLCASAPRGRRREVRGRWGREAASGRRRAWWRRSPRRQPEQVGEPITPRGGSALTTTPARTGWRARTYG